MSDDDTVAIARLQERFEAHARYLSDIAAELREIRADIRVLKEDRVRITGGYYVLIGIGYVVAFMMGAWDRIAKWFH